MGKKKLLITASTFPRWSGDTEPRFILDYAKAMSDYYDVTVLVPSAPNARKKEILEGVKVVRYRYFPIKRLETLCYPGAIVGRIKKKKIRALLVPWLLLSFFCHLLYYSRRNEVIHAHWLVPQGIIQSFISKPFIITGHGTDVTSMNSGLLRKLKAYAVRKAKYMCTVSDKLKNTVLDFSEISSDKIEVIPMGCDVKEFGKNHYVENYFGQDNKKVILFVGRLAEIKGVSYLINAVQDIDVKLIIVGEGELRDLLETQASAQKEKIVFLGAKTHDQLKEIYASADVFVAPSITTESGSQEGFGLVIIEAMASGLPVIATETGGIVDIIQNEENGLLCREKDSQAIKERIVELINNESLYQKLQKKGYETAKRYDYTTVAKRYKGILDKI